MDTTTTTSNDICRICFDDDTSTEQLVAPCKCNGSSKWVHLSCLRRWRRTCDTRVGREVCDVCCSVYDDDDAFTITWKDHLSMRVKQVSRHPLFPECVMFVVGVIFSIIAFNWAPLDAIQRVWHGVCREKITDRLIKRHAETWMQEEMWRQRNFARLFCITMFEAFQVPCGWIVVGFILMY